MLYFTRLEVRCTYLRAISVWDDISAGENRIWMLLCHIFTCARYNPDCWSLLILSHELMKQL